MPSPRPAPPGRSRSATRSWVFQAIRTCDVDLLARLVTHDPALANASEDWSADEGFESDLSFSERATALVRAAGTGDLRLVQVLVEAGAPVSGTCGCVDRESPLVAAVNIGATDIVEFLIEHGAPLDDLAFDGGSTALHVAVHRDDHRIVRMLLAAGADPTLRDGNGRTATEWSVLKGTNRPQRDRGDLLWTRIRPIDPFAPLRRGALVHVPPAYGLGAMRTIYGIVDALDAHFWMLGFEHGPYARITFDPTRANLRIWPAIDPAHTNARDYPDPRHHEIATAARETLTAYASIDPVLDLPDPGTFSDPALAERAQQLHRYLSHAFRPFEHLAAEPAADTPIAQLLLTVEEILQR